MPQDLFKSDPNKPGKVVLATGLVIWPLTIALEAALYFRGVAARAELLEAIIIPVCLFFLGIIGLAFYSTVFAIVAPKGPIGSFREWGQLITRRLSLIMSNWRFILGVSMLIPAIATISKYFR